MGYSQVNAATAAQQAHDLLAQPEIETTEGKRDRDSGGALGCALRRSELAALESKHIQQRDGRWVFIDLVGKGKRVRTVPIPPFVKVAIDACGTEPRDTLRKSRAAVNAGAVGDAAGLGDGEGNSGNCY